MSLICNIQARAKILLHSKRTITESSPNFLEADRFFMQVNSFKNKRREALKLKFRSEHIRIDASNGLLRQIPATHLCKDTPEGIVQGAAPVLR